MSKHSLAPGFVLQRLDDKGRARWELNRPAEEEKKKKKKMGKSNGLEGRSEAWQTWAVSRSVEKKRGGGEEGRPDKK